MKADERKELETNSLAQGVSALVERAKSGRLFNYRVAGIVVAVVVALIAWRYVAWESRKGMSKQWSELISPVTTLDDLKKFGTDHKDTAPGRVARLEYARVQLGPEGIGQLRQADRDKRNKGIENIEAAREELLKLADEFKGDKALQAAALLDAAEAELALVGVPKGGDSLGSLSRGAVDRAVELYRRVAATVGESTPAGEQAKKRADELAKNKERVEADAKTIYDYLNTAPSFTTPPPGPTPDGPKAPPSLTPTPGPDLPKPELPKPPDAITPPPSPGATTPTKK